MGLQRTSTVVCVPVRSIRDASLLFEVELLLEVLQNRFVIYPTSPQPTI